MSWLNALAFSLSGLPAELTGAAAMAYTLYDLHRDGASLDYPQGNKIVFDRMLDILNKSSGCNENYVFVIRWHGSNWITSTAHHNEDGQFSIPSKPSEIYSFESILGSGRY
jgi:hypothetical protein